VGSVGDDRRQDLVDAVRCTSCLRNIAAGVEAQKMIVEYRQPDGSLKVFGYMMSDGPLAKATGQMVRGWHHKHFWVEKKREARGDAVTGRVVAGGPTGYDIDQIALSKDDLVALGITEAEALSRGTGHLSARVARLRELAEQIGKGVGDPQVAEAFAAAEHGGPYYHQHAHRLDTYQLIAHLRYAHGVGDVSEHPHELHGDLHAQAALSGILSDRADDAEQRRTTDWRDQYTAVLKERT
jgi:hypothetical protein